MTYSPGEIVDITIKGARIAKRDSTDRLWFTLGGEAEGYVPSLPGDTATVTVERVAPAEWPPLAGDLWLDRNGRPWFAFDAADYEKGDVEMVRFCGVSSYNNGTAEIPAKANQMYGPMTLARRVGAA